MKLNKDFLFHSLGEESVLVPTGNAAFSGIVRGNKTLGAVLELLRNETTEDALVASMRERYEAPDGVIERDVKETLEKLREIGALDE